MDLGLRTLTWTKPVVPPALGPGDLHLWKIPCGLEEMDLEALRPLLSPRERTRAERLHLAHHRARYVRAHAGLRLVLASYINRAPQDVVFEYGDAGKPALVDDSGGPKFNLTTSDELALVAISRDLPVGIDCEQLRPRHGLEAIARRMFPPEEARRIGEAPEDERLPRFTLAWTALEAAVKADGRGLFRRRDVPPLPALRVAHCIPQEGFIAAVARAELPPVDEWGVFLLG